MASVFVIVSFLGGQFAFELLDPEAEILDDLCRFVPCVFGVPWLCDDAFVFLILCWGGVVDGACYPSTIRDLLVRG